MHGLDRRQADDTGKVNHEERALHLTVLRGVGKWTHRDLTKVRILER